MTGREEPTDRRSAGEELHHHQDLFAPSIEDLLTWIALFGALVLVVVVRLWIPYDQVFQGGDVVLAANDPYFPRYAVDQLLESRVSPFSLSDLAGLPAEIRNHDVAFIVTMWTATVIFGGTAHAGGITLPGIRFLRRF